LTNVKWIVYFICYRMDLKSKKFKIPSTISETIYQFLRETIISGELKPGQRIQEKDIAKIFNVSSTPVREAFFRLSAEKYLVINSRREVLVEEKSLTEVQELYEVVRALDIIATKKALHHLTEKDIQELEAMTNKLSEYFKKQDSRKYLQMNLMIHDKIWQRCGNRFLYETLTELMKKIAVYRRSKKFKPFTSSYAIDKSHRDHLNLFKAIKEQDKKGIEKIISTHWGEEFFKEKKNQKVPSKSE